MQQSKLSKYGLLTLKILAGLAFLGAGLAKLSGAEMMVQMFDAIGVGQWFRYLTGIIEIGATVLLFVPGAQVFGAALLGATMIGATFTHFVLGGTAAPALVLLAIISTIAWTHRDQLPLGRWGRTA
ncbi:MAG: DoxX family protein [Alphaproteobacteria bacterium]